MLTDFRTDENGCLTSASYWRCLHCHNWNKNERSKCLSCYYPKGWLTDEKAMLDLGWQKLCASGALSSYYQQVDLQDK